MALAQRRLRAVTFYPLLACTGLYVVTAVGFWRDGLDTVRPMWVFFGRRGAEGSPPVRKRQVFAKRASAVGLAPTILQPCRPASEVPPRAQKGGEGPVLPVNERHGLSLRCTNPPPFGCQSHPATTSAPRVRRGTGSVSSRCTRAFATPSPSWDAGWDQACPKAVLWF